MLEEDSFDVRYLPTGSDDYVTSLAETCGVLVAGHSHGGIRTWGLDGKHVDPLRDHGGTVSSLVGVGDMLASAGEETVKLWERDSATCLRVLEGHTDKVRSLAVFQNLLASGSDDETIRLWDPATGECVRTLVRNHSSVTCLTVFRDHLVSGSSDGIVCWWTANGDIATVGMGHTRSVLQLAHSEDFLFSASMFEIIAWNRAGRKMRTFDLVGTDVPKMCFWNGSLVVAQYQEVTKFRGERV